MKTFEKLTKEIIYMIQKDSNLYFKVCSEVHRRDFKNHTDYMTQIRTEFEDYLWLREMSR